MFAFTAKKSRLIFLCFKILKSVRQGKPLHLFNKFTIFKLKTRDYYLKNLVFQQRMAILLSTYNQRRLNADT